MDRIELKKNNLYHFYVKNDAVGKKFHYKAKYIGENNKIMQVFDLQTGDFVIFPISDLTNVYPCEVVENGR